METSQNHQLQNLLDWIQATPVSEMKRKPKKLSQISLLKGSNGLENGTEKCYLTVTYFM